MFTSASVTISGNLGEYCYTSDLGSKVTKAFCPTCGSPIYGVNSRTSDHLTISLGSIDDAQGLAVQVVIFDRDKQHWDQLVEGVLVFNTQPNWTPKD